MLNVRFVYPLRVLIQALSLLALGVAEAPKTPNDLFQCGPLSD